MNLYISEKIFFNLFLVVVFQKLLKYFHSKETLQFEHFILRSNVFFLVLDLLYGLIRLVFGYLKFFYSKRFNLGINIISADIQVL